MVTCAGCPAEFELLPNKRMQKYCSPRCGKQDWARRQRKPSWETRECGHCGVVFEHTSTMSHQRRYCSAECKKAKAAERQRSQRWRHVSRRYGLTPADFDQMMIDQDNRCAICSLLLEGRGLEVDAPQVDHDHKTGTLRAILCRPCNTALGLFRDDQETVQRAIEYLRFWSQPKAGDNPRSALRAV